MWPVHSEQEENELPNNLLSKDRRLVLEQAKKRKTLPMFEEAASTGWSLPKERPLKALLKAFARLSCCDGL
jgi:hypothetical protein